MKATTEVMLHDINEKHDWTLGQTRGGSGTLYTRTDTCRICSLRRHYRDDSQNGCHDEFRFSDGETDQDLSLRQAFFRGCTEVSA
jgi:hypothetical protein